MEISKEQKLTSPHDMSISSQECEKLKEKAITIIEEQFQKHEKGKQVYSFYIGIFLPEQVLKEILSKYKKAGWNSCISNYHYDGDDIVGYTLTLRIK